MREKLVCYDYTGNIAMALTSRERIMRLMRGEPIDVIPWFPRIDLWYNFHKRQKTLPPEYELTMEELIKKIGGGIYHRETPLYRERLRNVEIEIRYSNPIWKDRIENADTGLDRNYILGLVLQSLSHSKGNALVKFKEITTLGDNEVLVQFETPRGKVSAKFVTSEMLQEAGIRPYQSEYFIKDINKDLGPLKYIIGNIDLEPAFDDFTKTDTMVGEEGIVWARVSPYYSPMHQLMYIYMGLEQTCLALYDHKNKFDEIVEFIEVSLNKVHELCLDSPALFVNHGGNFDSTVLGPELFEAYFVPYLSKFAEKLHSKNKFLVVHVDGEMKNLMDLFPLTNSDVAEGFTPSPMTQVSFHEALRMWAGKVVIWGGIPATLLSKDTYEDEFYGYIRTLLDEGKTSPFVLSMGDNTPIDADLKRLEKVSEMVNRTAIN